MLLIPVLLAPVYFWKCLIALVFSAFISMKRIVLPLHENVLSSQRKKRKVTQDQYENSRLNIFRKIRKEISALYFSFFLF